jgi:hypothetical protein
MRFLCIHGLPAGMTIEDLRSVAEKSQKSSDVHGIRSYLNLSSGKGVCIFEASSREKLEDFLRSNNLTYDEIIPIEVEGEHGVFTDLRTTEAVAV